MVLVGMEVRFGSRNNVIAGAPKLIPVANQKFYPSTHFFFGGEESGNVIMLWLFRDNCRQSRLCVWDNLHNRGYQGPPRTKRCKQGSQS